MHELGLLEDLLELPHQRVTSVSARIGDFEFHAADFSHLPTHCEVRRADAAMGFSQFSCRARPAIPRLQLRMQHEGMNLIRDGATSRWSGGAIRRTVPCRSRRIWWWPATAGIQPSGRPPVSIVQEFGVPIDVLWFRISRRAGDPEQVLGNINYGKALILINRGDYFQAGMIIRKGSFEQLKSDGLDAFREAIARIAPYLADRVGELAKLGSDQAADGADQPAAPVVSSGLAVHRRCRARHVAGGRCRN